MSLLPTLLFLSVHANARAAAGVVDTLVLPAGAGVVAWADLDGDGGEEIVWLSSSRRRLHVSASDAVEETPRFSWDLGEEAMRGGIGGDLDGDGHPEAWVSGQRSGRLHLLDHGDSGWRVTVQDVGYYLSHTVCLVHDPDGHGELWMATDGFPTRLWALNGGTGELRTLMEGAGGEVALSCPGDLDGDGVVDALLGDNGYRDEPWTLWRSSNGTTQRVETDWTQRRGWIIADLDDAGRDDLWVAHPREVVRYQLVRDRLVRRGALALPDCRVVGALRDAPDTLLCVRDGRSPLVHSLGLAAGRLVPIATVALPGPASRLVVMGAAHVGTRVVIGQLQAAGGGPVTVHRIDLEPAASHADAPAP